MMKNDITYEYRVFTNRLVDVGTMEVGICTSKVIKELKPKNKVDGRFFHTSDTDEWYFCWNGELQKLNLKGDSDVNAALAEVEKLIADAKTAVSDAKNTAADAKKAADEAKVAADAASAAVENIGNKADRSEVEAVSKAVEAKADASVVESLSKKVDDIKVPTNVSAFTNDAGYLTSHQDISGKQDKIDDLDDIRAGVELAKSALQAVPAGYATEDFVNDKIAELDFPSVEVPTKVSAFENDANYLTADVADLKYAPIGGEGVDLSDYATKDFVGKEIEKIDIPTVPTNVSAFTNDAGYLTSHQDISGKQDKIDDLDDIRAGVELAKSALQEVPAEYVTEKELEDKGYLTDHQSLDNYYTKKEVDDKLDAINALIGQAIDITNTILA